MIETLAEYAESCLLRAVPRPAQLAPFLSEFKVWRAVCSGEHGVFHPHRNKLPSIPKTTQIPYQGASGLPSVNWWETLFLQGLFRERNRFSPLQQRPQANKKEERKIFPVPPASRKARWLPPQLDPTPPAAEEGTGKKKGHTLAKNHEAGHFRAPRGDDEVPNKQEV